MSRLPDADLEVLEAEAIKETNTLASSDRRRTAATMHVFCVRGPLLPEAEHRGIDSAMGLKQSRRNRAPNVVVDV